MFPKQTNKLLIIFSCFLCILKYFVKTKTVQKISMSVQALSSALFLPVVVDTVVYGLLCEGPSAALDLHQADGSTAGHKHA